MLERTSSECPTFNEVITLDRTLSLMEYGVFWLQLI